MDTEQSAITEPVRRLEVFSGAGRRRTWRDQDKARICCRDRDERRLGLCRGSTPWIIAAPRAGCFRSAAIIRGASAYQQRDHRDE
jgi:hypothetical protein